MWTDRPKAERVAEHAARGAGRGELDGLGVGVAFEAVERACHAELRLLHEAEFGQVELVRDAARDHFRRTREPAVGVERDHDDHQAAFGHAHPVAQHVARDRIAVLDVNAPSFDFFRHPHPSRIDLYHGAVLHDQRLGHTEGTRERGVALQMNARPVHGDESPRPGEFDHAPLLVLTSMSAHMEGGVVAAREDAHSAPLERVDRFVHLAFAPRNDARGQDHLVARFERDRAVLPQREPAQRCARFALRAGRDHEQLAARHGGGGLLRYQ